MKKYLFQFLLIFFLLSAHSVYASDVIFVNQTANTIFYDSNYSGNCQKIYTTSPANNIHTISAYIRNFGKTYNLYLRSGSCSGTILETYTFSAYGNANDHWQTVTDSSPTILTPNTVYYLTVGGQWDYFYGGNSSYPYDYYVSGSWSTTRDMALLIYYDTNYLVVCGDGVIAGSETCDDGNTVNGDGCSSSCTLQACSCGNSIIQSYQNSYGSCYETCDDGNTNSGDGCNRYCNTEKGLAGGLASTTLMTAFAQSTVGFTDGFKPLLQNYLGIILYFVILSIIFTIVIRFMWSMKKRGKPFVFNLEQKKFQHNKINNYFSDSEVSRREHNLTDSIKAYRAGKGNKYD